MYLLGFDIGSSSVKVALVEAATKKVVDSVQSPSEAMIIDAPEQGWAEQDPEMWWKHVCIATKQILTDNQIEPNQIRAIGIAYQMHGLVLVDRDLNSLRPSIIWCDSRAVEIGNQAFESIGGENCLSCMLNSPGNFTASKLKWVKENEPEIYNKAAYFMLPGDFIALKLTGRVATTVSGLSEGILWDFQKQEIAEPVLKEYGIDRHLIPPILPTLSNQGELTEQAAQETGLRVGTPVTYRAGDQPNNAMSLNVLNPGEVAATGGTSGVVYGVIDYPAADQASRVNGFAHVNYSQQKPMIGVLLCINGAGILYNWTRQQVLSGQVSFPDMEQMAQSIPIGSDALRIIPFGNGAERILENNNPGAQINNLQLNRHQQAHIVRAALEGVAFSFVYGIEILKDLGLETNIIRVGNDNLFQSDVFSSTIATLANSQIEIMRTNGAIGAAKASGVAVGLYQSLREAMSGNELIKAYEPKTAQLAAYKQAYQSWKKDLERLLA